MKNIKFITAGAGSGKTFTLTKMLVDAVSNDGVLPSEIILTTFTKAAASEFKQKAMKAMLDASAKETDAAKAEKLKECALQLDGAMIGTIDSLSQRFVQKYWYLLDISPDLKVITDEVQKYFVDLSLEKVISDDDRNFFKEIYDCFDIRKIDNGKKISDPDFWKKHLENVISLKRNYSIANNEASIIKTNDLVGSIFSNSNPIVWTYIDNVINVEARKILKKNNAGVLDYFPVTAQTEIDTLDKIKLKGHTYAAINALVKYLEGKITGAGRGNKGDIPVGRTQNFIPWSWDDMLDKCNDYLQSADFGNMLKQYAETIFNIANNWAVEYENIKKENHVIDYNDMKHYFIELLSKPEVEVKNDIQSDFKLVMVDEYQDCDPLQVEIFNTLSDIVADGKGHSVWVGDRKQAIYGFRGSDMELIDSVINKFPETLCTPDANGLETDKLKYSYRSRKSLVDAATNIFSPIFSDAALTAKRQVDDQDDMPSVPSVIDWQISNQPTYYEQLAAKVKLILKNKDTDIKNVVDYKFNGSDYEQKMLRNVEPQDIAILVDSNYNIPNVVDALNELGIKVSTEDQNIAEFIEIKLIVAVMLYCVEKSDYTRAQILHLFDGKSVKEIIEEKIGGSLNNTNKTIEHLESILIKSKGQSLVQLVETIIAEFNLWADVAKWGQDRRRKNHLSTFIQIVKRYEDGASLQGRGASVMDFLNHFNSGKINCTQPFVKPTDAVSVLTYHKSKGLEWPVVILCSLHKESLDANNLIDKYIFGVQHAPNNASEVERSKRGEYITVIPDLSCGGNLPECIIKALNAKVNTTSTIYNKVQSERARLMYVGFTRAKDYLVTATKSNDDNAYMWLQEIGVYRDFEAKAQCVEVNGVTAKGTSSTEYDEVVLPDVEKVETLKKYVNPSTSGAANAAELNVKGTAKVGKAFSITAPHQMAYIGTCIHNIYAVYDDKKNHDQNVKIAEDMLNANNLATIASQANGLIVAIEQLFKYLKDKYGEYKEIYHELPILYKNDIGQIINGEIDLVWKTADRCVVVDYKNKEHVDASNPGSKYLAQLGFYKEALTKNGETVDDMILFYPLQGKITIIK